MKVINEHIIISFNIIMGSYWLATIKIDNSSDASECHENAM